MKRLIWTALAVLAGSGCAANHGPDVARRPVWVPDDTAVPRVIVYGSLDNLLPARDDTPALEKFLYGPNPGRFSLSHLRNPQGMARLGARILVCDQGFPDILAVDMATGRSVSWGDADHRPRCPVDIATDDAGGRVYVADTTLRSVLVYAGDERFVRELCPTGGSREPFRPSSVVVDEGILYVGNLAGRKVERFDVARETWLPAFAPSGEELALVAPTGIAAGPAGDLLVVDALQGVVHRVTKEGRWLIPIGKPGREAGQFVRPKQVRCTPSGLIFVSDAGRQSVVVFDAEGRFLFEVSGDTGNGRGFSLPMGLVAVASSELPVLAKRFAEDPGIASDECMIVSDTLGGQSLIVLGVVGQATEGHSDAH